MNQALHRISAAMAGTALLGSAAAGADGLPPLVLVNESPSLPKGAYVLSAGVPVDRGSVVAVPQPVSARAYLRSQGMPSTTLLLKRVAGIGGDHVCAGAGVVETPVREVAVRARDGRGAGLSAWRGCRALAADELFLLGDTPSSYDSRYFGPVSRNDLTGVYREVVKW